RDPHNAPNQCPIDVLSGRPDAISGGDSLIQVGVRKNVALNQMRIKLNGTDITAKFLANNATRTLTGLVTGLKLGENLLEVIDPRGNVQGHGRADADIILTNYPIEGPIFSGPHEQPFACATQQFNLPAGLGNLGAPLDANCSIARRVDYIYRTTTNTFAALPAGATSYPANMVMTVTTLGKTVPYIVRMETGTITRAIYQTTVLHDPITEPSPAWKVQPSNWNKRLIYTFGGGGVGGWDPPGSLPRAL